MTAEPQEREGAEVIDLSAHRRNQTTVTPVPDPPQKKAEGVEGKGRGRWTLPKVTPPDPRKPKPARRLPKVRLGWMIQIPKRCACCVGRGVRRGGDAWGRWVSEDGHKWDHTKKTGGWCVGGLLFVAILPGPVGWVILSVIGLVAAVVAGWTPTTEQELTDRGPDRAGSKQPGPVGPVDRTDPIGSAGPARTDPMGTTGPVGPGRLEQTGPVRSGQTDPDRPGPVAVGPPSTSPLVGRTAPINVWTDPVRIGLDAFGGPVQMVVPGQPGLLSGGVSGSGKSVAAHQLLCHVALDPHAQLWLVDGKVVELIHYKGLAHRYLDEPNLGAFTELVDDLDEEMKRRKKAIAGKAVKVTGDNWERFNAPFILFHIDEIQIYSLQGKEGEKLAQRLALLASQCRAFAIFISVATQRPENAVTPPLLCNNLVLKLAMRTEDASQSNTILGTGMAGRGYRSDRFTGEQKGAGYFRGEVGDPVALTTGYLQIPDEGEEGDNHVRDLVAQAVKFREQAGTLPDPDHTSPATGGGILAQALEVMGERTQITRSDLAALLGFDDEQKMREQLQRAGVCAPHSLHGETGRGWKRTDLEAARS